MTLRFIEDLGLSIHNTDVGTQKINGSALKIYEMATAWFFVHNKLERIWFFEEMFLLVNTSMKIVVRMLFLFFSNIDFNFEIEGLI